MIPYFIFIFFLLLCYWSKKPLWMLVTLIVFAVLRYDTGWDYGMYVHVVETPAFWNDGDASRFSLAWRGLFALSHRLNAPHFAIAVANLLTYVILYVSLCVMKLTRRQKLQALLVYALWNEFYLTSFSTIRQALAMTIGVLMFALIQRKKFILSILTCCVAVHIHTSAIILVLLYPIYFFRNYLDFKWLCVSVIIMSLILASIEPVLLSLSDIGLDKYGAYLKWHDNFGGKLIYLNVILAVYFIFVFYKNKRKTLMERQCYFMVLSGVFGGIAIYIYGGSIVFMRMLSYFTIFLIFILFQSVEIFKERATLRAILNCMLVLFFVVYLSIISNGGGHGNSSYVPYKCILSK